MFVDLEAGKSPGKDFVSVPTPEKPRSYDPPGPQNGQGGEYGGDITTMHAICMLVASVNVHIDVCITCMASVFV